MNLYLRGIGANGGQSPIRVDDSLASHPGEYFDPVLTNPPFGKKSSVTYVTDESELRRESTRIVRDDFWTSTSNKHFALKQNPLTHADLDEFVACYRPENRHARTATWSEETPDGRWRAYTYDELVARDKANLDLFWLRDESLEETANLPEPDVLAAEIVDEQEAALEQFRAIVEDLEG
jgi:type I restriction-modification system DNA methylase subunit